MRQKPNGLPSQLWWSYAISEVVAVCGHLGFFILRELKQKESGDQRSQNIRYKSSHKHILNLAPKSSAQQKFEFFETCRAGLCPEPQRPVKASSGLNDSQPAPAPADQT
jgi:hypothetical protein